MKALSKDQRWAFASRISSENSKTVRAKEKKLESDPSVIAKGKKVFAANIALQKSAKNLQKLTGLSPNNYSYDHLNTLKGCITAMAHKKYLASNSERPLGTHEIEREIIILSIDATDMGEIQKKLLIK
jgi:hypothetical protein